MIQYADLLYRVAYSKVENTYDAEDLVQETYLGALIAINKRTKIDNLKAYLLKILDYKAYQFLKKKYQLPTVYINDSQFEVVLAENLTFNQYDSDIEKTDEVVAIRRELAYLSKIYREVMVQYYMEGKAVNDIATNLNISRGTVLSRLDVGRKIVKDGIIKAKAISEKTYQSAYIYLSIYGKEGLNYEPYNVINSLIDENILIQSYEKPLTVKEVSEIIGVPTVYTEPIIAKLLHHELMRKVKNKIFTDFIIADLKLIKDNNDKQKTFVNDTFSKFKPTLIEFVSKYKESGILDKFNDTQLYLYALLVIFRHIRSYCIQTLKLMDYDDFPDRPNEGKWIIYVGHKFDRNEKDIRKPMYASISDIPLNFAGNISFEEWINPLSVATWHDEINVTTHEKGHLLYSLHKEQDIDPVKMMLIPNLIDYGILVNQDNKKIVNIPIISAEGYEALMNLNREFAKVFIEKIGNKLIKAIKKNAINHPKHIKSVSNFSHLKFIDGMALEYFLKANEEGIVALDKNIKYPIMTIVEKNTLLDNILLGKK